MRGNNIENREGPNFSREKQKDVFAGTKLGTNVSQEVYSITGRDYQKQQYILHFYFVLFASR